MEEILHHLRLVASPIIYKVLWISGGDRQISAINSNSTYFRLISLQLPSSHKAI